MTECVKNYAVVEFDEIKSNNKVVELVPIGWLSENGSTYVSTATKKK